MIVINLHYMRKQTSVTERRNKSTKGEYFLKYKMKEATWFFKERAEVLKTLDVDEQTGLSNAEVLLRRNKTGVNELQKEKRKTVLRLFFTQLQDWLIYILFAATLITVFVGAYVDAVIILCVIILNALLGVFQEIKASNAIEELQKISRPRAIVKRENTTTEIDAKDLVPGDVVILEVGRSVPADIRLLETIDLKIDESAITGESVLSLKDASFITDDHQTPLGDRYNMAYMSTLVSTGRGLGIVTATGMKTEIGKIANLITGQETHKTPLEKRLEHLGKTLGRIAICVCLLIFVIAMAQGRNLLDMFLLSVSLAVASIPEGLAAIVAIVLSIGVTRMSKQNAIIRKLSAVETLGSVTIICSDKTGTLTQNRMKVTDYCLSNGKEGDPLSLAKAMILCSDATVGDGQVTGDPTEIALLQWGDELQINRKSLYESNKRIAELPFDSDRKLMSTVVEENGSYTVYTKGALDELMEKCRFVAERGEKELLDDEKKQFYREFAENMSNQSLRVLSAAYKSIDSNKVKPEDLEQNLILLGFVGMIDPLREEAVLSVQKAKSAGIITVMITGDHKKTAFAIAHQLRIANKMEEVITGQEIDRLSEEEFIKQVMQYRVFARVSPEHKVKIVNALKRCKNIVSMTGDGVNDAPSLRAADIGVAMGITGTDVAKSAADMVLTDDNYATIITAVEQGRNIYNNIKKSVIFLLSCNLGEVFTLVFSLLLGWPTPLLATQLLWVNLITDSLPAVTLGMNPSNPEVMKAKPRRLRESFFSGGATTQVFWGGLLIGLNALFAFYYGFYINEASPFNNVEDDEILSYAQTMAFIVLVGSQLLYALSLRSKRKHLFRLSLLFNKYLVYAIITGFILQLTAIMIPFLREAFHLELLSWTDWAVALLFSFFPLLITELVKMLRVQQEKS